MTAIAIFDTGDVSLIRAFLFVPQNWEIINTAVLTGKQISHAMKVFVVSYAGKISDVTRQSVCQIEDDSVLKVITPRHTRPVRERRSFVPRVADFVWDRIFKNLFLFRPKGKNRTVSSIRKKSSRARNKSPHAFGAIFLYASKQPGNYRIAKSNEFYRHRV